MALKRLWGRNLALLVFLSATSTSSAVADPNLRQAYGQPIQHWPAAQTADNQMPARLAPLNPKGQLASAGKIALGAKLFNDPILSKDNSISCASCHLADRIFQDGKTTAVGIDEQVGERNTPPLFGIDHWQTFFWDGRARTATEQALQPIQNPIEMNLSIDEALQRLNKSTAYSKAFADVFDKTEITAPMLAMALVAFERSIPAPPTRYQAFISQAETEPKRALEQLTDDELHGLHLFRTKAKCMTCHEGPLLSDNEFHVTGFHFYKRRFEDLGRVHVTQHSDDIGKFRTPSLLGVTQTGPWMHNGLFTQFEPMIQQYNAGGFRPKPRGKLADDPHYPYTTELLVPLHLTDSELKDLIAFLKIL